MTLYLDHNATAPVDPRVLERFLAVERDNPGNPSSLHTFGRRARAIVEAARAQVAAALGTGVDDVLFVSGGTEANNLAVAGLGDPALPVLLADVEHPSVRMAALARGCCSWRVDASGCAVVEPPQQPVGLLCLVHGQSEVGSLQDLDAAAQLAVRLGVPLHVDAAQTLGRVPVTFAPGIHSLSLSPHKAGGLRGGGVLVVRDGAAGLRPLLHGGAQERGRRPGTVSPALAAATALAIELAQREQAPRAAAMAAARDEFVVRLAQSGVPHRLLTPARSLPNTAMVAFTGVDGRLLLPALDLRGVAASHGSACSSGSPEPPPVLLAMGLDRELARACVRFSFGAAQDRALAAQSATLVADAVRSVARSR